MEKQKIIAISGKKQSGKSSLRNFLMGIKLTDSGMLRRFNISTKGELMVPSVIDNKETMQCLDLNQNNFEFRLFAQQKIWPVVKNYSIANYLKYMCIDLFGVEYEQCFGSDDDKNTETNIRWSDIAFAIPPRTVGAIKSSGRLNYFLTARELMECFGQICRKINKDCWISKCINQINQEGYPFIIIDDVRYPNELELLNNFDIFTIRLHRNPYPSDTEGEISLDGYTGFDLNIPEDSSIVEKQDIALKALREKGWL